MHSMVPILMSLGGIAFVIGIFVYARFGLQQIKQVKFFGKTYKLWRFTIATVGSGILLIWLSIFIHKNVPYVPESATQLPLSAQAARTDFEQELALSEINSKAMMAYIKSFQQEYQTALSDDDKTTINLLRMELQFRLRTELENRGLEESQIDQEVKRIMERLPQNSK